MIGRLFQFWPDGAPIRGKREAARVQTREPLLLGLPDLAPPRPEDTDNIKPGSGEPAAWAAIVGILIVVVWLALATGGHV